MDPSVFGLTLYKFNYNWEFLRSYRADETALKAVKKGASNIIQYKIVANNLTFSGLWIEVNLEAIPYIYTGTWKKAEPQKVGLREVSRRKKTDER